MSRLLEALHSGRVLVMDGAMGTELQRLGLADGECSALWNLTHPETVGRVHAAYLEAGAEVLLTNTFMANQAEFFRRGAIDRLPEVWTAAMQIARIFRQPAPIVLADLGPCARDAPRYPMSVVNFGSSADGLLFETFPVTSFPRLGNRLAGVNRTCDGGPRLPVLMSFAFRRDFKEWHGLSTKVGKRTLKDIGVVAFGANCGAEIDMDDLLEIVRAYREETDLPLFVRPNAGTPRRTAAGWEYPRSPDEIADKLWPLLEAGVTMVGGCCGTTPAHIAAFRRVVDEWNAKKV